VLDEGKIVSPRGQKTFELSSPYTSRIDACRAIVLEPQRKVGYRLLCAEAAYILEGSNRVAILAPYGKHIARYSDDGVTFFGAYGPKLHDQWDYCINKLKQDQDTRQAVINIWRENPPKTRNVPCTLSWQFLLRNNELNLNVTMRSSDSWMGWVYDVFAQAMVIAATCLQLRHLYPGIQPGSVYLTAGSQHLYESNWAQAREIIQAPDIELTNKSYTLDIDEFDDVDHLVRHLWTIARRDTTVSLLTANYLSVLKERLNPTVPKLEA